MRTKNIGAVIAVRLNASRKRRVCVRLNMSARGEAHSALGDIKDRTQRYIRTCLYL